MASGQTFGPNDEQPEDEIGIEEQRRLQSSPAQAPAPPPPGQMYEQPETYEFNPQNASANTGYTGGMNLGAQVQPAPTPPSGVPAMGNAEGFDAAKWADPTQGTSNKYVVGRILAGGGTIEQAAAAVGAKVISPDKIQFPDGFIADLYRDEEGDRAIQYTQVGGPGMDAGGTGGVGQTGGGFMAPGSPGTGTPGSGNAFTDQVRSFLMQQLGGLSGPLTANDPQIKAEMDAQSSVLERNRRDRRAADAERAAMQGLLNGGQSSGSFEQNVASGFEDKGRALTGIQAQLFTRELQSRRGHLAQLMSMALQSGDNEAARELQFKLANMDAELRRLGLAQNQSQWNDSFGLDAARFQYGKDRDLAQYGAGY